MAIEKGPARPSGEPLRPQESTSRVTRRDGDSGPPASYALTLHYQGHRLRTYRDTTGGIWFLLSDIFRALEKRNTGNMRKRITCASDITEVSAWVVNHIDPEASGYRMVQAASSRGIRTMLGISKQQPSIDLLEWLNQWALPRNEGTS
jgi:hypothetical protein